MGQVLQRHLGPSSLPAHWKTSSFGRLGRDTCEAGRALFGWVHDHVDVVEVGRCADSADGGDIREMTPIAEIEILVGGFNPI